MRPWALAVGLLLLAPAGLASHSSSQWSTEIIAAWLDPVEGPEGDQDPWLFRVSALAERTGSKPFPPWVWAVAADDPSSRYQIGVELEQGVPGTCLAPGERAMLDAVIDVYGLVGPMRVRFASYQGHHAPILRTDVVIEGLPEGTWLGSFCDDTLMNSDATNCGRLGREGFAYDMATPWDHCLDFYVPTYPPGVPSLGHVNPTMCTTVSPT